MNSIKKFIWIWKHFEEYENSIIIGEPIDLDYIKEEKEVKDGTNIWCKYAKD